MRDDHGERGDRVGNQADGDRLAGLQEEAAIVYAEITRADEALRGLAARRVAAERELRAWGTRHLVASRIAEAHARERPGPFTQLATRFRAGREWRARQAAIDGVLAGPEGAADAANRALDEVQAEFAAQVAVRAGLAARLRALTAECAAAQRAIAAELLLALMSVRDMKWEH